MPVSSLCFFLPDLPFYLLHMSTLGTFLRNIFLPDASFYFVYSSNLCASIYIVHISTLSISALCIFQYFTYLFLMHLYTCCIFLLDAYFYLVHLSSWNIFYLFYLPSLCICLPFCIFLPGASFTWSIFLPGAFRLLTCSRSSGG